MATFAINITIKHSMNPWVRGQWWPNIM